LRASATHEGTRHETSPPRLATSRMRLISLGHFEVKRLKKDAPGVYRSIEELVEERSE